MPPEKSLGQLFYFRLPENARKGEKLDFLIGKNLGNVDWRRLTPSHKHTWLTTETEAEFDRYMPIGSKEAKRANNFDSQTIFVAYSLGVATGRDVWVYEFNERKLNKNMHKHISNYNLERARLAGNIAKGEIETNDLIRDNSYIKWTDRLISALSKNLRLRFQDENIRNSYYRPFTKKIFYFDQLLTHRRYQQHLIFPNKCAEAENRVICCTDVAYRSSSVSCLVFDSIPNLSVLSTTDGHQTFPFYTYDADGSNRRENITDFALEQFRSHYADPGISKWQIFYYVYAMLHHPGYRARYALDLKRSLPRIPFAPVCSNTRQNQLDIGDKSPSLILGEGFRVGGFQAFSRAGKQLADLHLNYESIDRYELDWQATRQPQDYRVEKMLPKGKVDAADGDYKVYSTLKYNESLTLHGIPERAFAYRLGNRSALDWVVDQYRVKTDKRSGIKHDPNGYSDDPQYILKLIERVITVSLRTVDIVQQLAQLPFRAESAGV